MTPGALQVLRSDALRNNSNNTINKAVFKLKMKTFQTLGNARHQKCELGAKAFVDEAARLTLLFSC